MNIKYSIVPVFRLSYQHFSNQDDFTNLKTQVTHTLGTKLKGKIEFLASSYLTPPTVLPKGMSSHFFWVLITLQIFLWHTVMQLAFFPFNSISRTLSNISPCGSALHLWWLIVCHCMEYQNLPSSLSIGCLQFFAIINNDSMDKLAFIILHIYPR